MGKFDNFSFKTIIFKIKKNTYCHNITLTTWRQWRVEKKENALCARAVTIYCYLRVKKLLIEHKNIFLVLNFYHFFYFFFGYIIVLYKRIKRYYNNRYVLLCILQQQHDNNFKFMDLRDCKYLFASIITKSNLW